jgi:hypothetical protein
MTSGIVARAMAKFGTGNYFSASRAARWGSVRANQVKINAKCVENMSKMIILQSNGPFQIGHFASKRPRATRHSASISRISAVCPVPALQCAGFLAACTYRFSRKFH